MKKLEKAIISLSVDDGCQDAYRLYELLKSEGIPATFNIITSHIGREKSLSADQIKEMSESPFCEIACHGHTHQNTSDDIAEANVRLSALIGEPDGGLWGFASPGSDMTRDYILANEKKLGDLGLLYVRSASNPSPEERHKELMAELEAEADDPWLIRNIPQLIFSAHGMFIPSAVLHHKDNLSLFIRLISLAIKEKAALVLMLHRVLKQGEDGYESTWSYDYQKLCELIKFLKENENLGLLKIATTRKLYELIKE